MKRFIEWLKNYSRGKTWLEAEIESEGLTDKDQQQTPLVPPSFKSD